MIPCTEDTLEEHVNKCIEYKTLCVTQEELEERVKELATFQTKFSQVTDNLFTKYIEDYKRYGTTKPQPYMVVLCCDENKVKREHIVDLTENLVKPQIVI